MADVTSPNLRDNPRSPIGAVLTPLRPALKRSGSGSGSVRFAEQASPPASALPARRPVFVREDTNQSFKTIDSQLSPSFPPPLLAPAPVGRNATPKGRIFGIKTAFKPLWLLGMGSLGNALYGTGTVAIERGIWARRPLQMPGEPMPVPEMQPLFGEVRYSLGLGIASTVGGLLLAGTACTLFYSDARKLARRQNPANPNYTRPTIYFGAHVTAIGLSAGSKFMIEALRDKVDDDYTWVAAVPGLIGQAIFAVTQANAAATCEILNRRQPLKHRAGVGFAARFCVAGYTIWAAMQGIPNFSVYGREVMRILAQVSLTVSYALPLTTARLGRHQGVDFESHQPQASWYALQLLGVYISGRILAGFGPDLMQVGLFTDADTEPFVFGGATALTAGTGFCIAALMLFRQDVASYSQKQANVLFGGACVALLCILAYVGLAQYAAEAQRRELVWVALVPGFIGSGLRLAILPSMFAYSELLHGDLPLPQRLYWTEASRSIAAICFGVWGVMSSQPTLNTYAREAVAVAAGSFATLGMALPTTTSRRALPQFAWPMSPGATPPANVDGVNYFASAFANHTASEA